MKNYKKGFLTLVVLSTMSLMAAEDKTIYVTTFDDEDGTNPDKCSLREALHAAATHKAYGGCSAGQVYSTVPNVIQFSVHDKFHRTLILSGFCLLKIAKISLNSSFFPKPIKR